MTSALVGKFNDIWCSEHSSVFEIPQSVNIILHLRMLQKCALHSLSVFPLRAYMLILIPQQHLPVCERNVQQKPLAYCMQSTVSTTAMAN